MEVHMNMFASANRSLCFLEVVFYRANENNTGFLKAFFKKNFLCHMEQYFVLPIEHTLFLEKSESLGFFSFTPFLGGVGWGGVLLCFLG
jgi:hypothetical protein